MGGSVPSVVSPSPLSAAGRCSAAWPSCGRPGSGGAGRGRSTACTTTASAGATAASTAPTSTTPRRWPCAPGEPASGRGGSGVPPSPRLPASTSSLRLSFRPAGSSAARARRRTAAAPSPTRSPRRRCAAGGGPRPCRASCQCPRPSLGGRPAVGTGQPWAQGAEERGQRASGLSEARGPLHRLPEGAEPGGVSPSGCGSSGGGRAGREGGAAASAAAATAFPLEELGRISVFPNGAPAPLSDREPHVECRVH